MSRQSEVYLTDGDLRCIQDVIHSGGLKRAADDTDGITERPQVTTTPKKCAGSNEWHTSASKRIEDTAKRLTGQEAAQFEAKELEMLVNQRNREALVERAECLLLANTEQHRALKAGLMRSDWLGALKEQEKWNQQLKDLVKQREQHHWRMWEEEKTKAHRREEEEKLGLREKIQELKACRLRQLEENKAKREKEKMVSAEEARQLKERIEQENRKFAIDEQQKRERDKQIHLTAMEWISRAGEEKLKEAKKLHDEEEAEAAFVKKRAPKLRQLEARAREMRERQVELRSMLAAFQPPEYEARQEARLRKDAEQCGQSLVLKEDAHAQKKAEQQRRIGEERLRQQKMKLESRAKIAREDAEFVKQWREENAQALLMEDLKKEERRQQYRETAAILQQQITAVKEKRHREREDEKNAVRTALAAIEKSEEAVGALQLRCVQNALRHGNSHWPIVKSLSKHSAARVRLHQCNGRERIRTGDPLSGEESCEER